jgi:hypothetical protein
MKLDFVAPQCTVKLRTGARDGNDSEDWIYEVSSSVAQNTIVDLQFKRVGSGFKIGKDGTSNYGTDPSAPWGSMRHTFWPRISVSGQLIVNGNLIEVEDGLGFFVHAMQGMKPHHLASRWNFINFQSPAYSAIMMEFTTPPSYGSRTVNIGCIKSDDKLAHAFVNNEVVHKEVKKDEFTGWNEPVVMDIRWNKSSENDETGKIDEADMTVELKHQIQRVDVLHEVPQFVKALLTGVVGTNPFVYQVNHLLTFFLLTVQSTVILRY